MEKGEVRFSGPTAELMRRPDLIRAVFMGGVGGSARSRRRGEVDLDLTAGPQLAVSNISVGFGGVQALRDVDLTVAADEIVGIIGPNGAGKTTLFDVISGFLRPDVGRVELGGEEVTSLSPDGRARLGLARSFQNARLFPSLTVRETIAVALERRANRSAIEAMVWSPRKRRSERLIAARVDDLVEMLGLEAYADKFVGELSTGTRRAVDVACIMAASPKLLLLDEPSSGLAQVETEELGPVLTRVARDAGCAMLIIEHDLPLVTSVSDRLIAMELGSVITTGKPADVVKDERVLSSYLSASEDVLARSDSAMVTIAAAVKGAKPAATPSLPQQDRG
jgi:branched-chain amino acid transport system ATP-binding protein